MSVLVALAALLIERAFGYPQWLTDRVGHPVMWMGWLIEKGEAAFNTADRSYAERGTMGIVLVLSLCGFVFFATLAIALFLRALPFGWLIEAALASTLLAQKELGRAVRAVADGLELSLAAGRAVVSRIVGRDTREIDAAAVSRAAIETLAENASDGVVAPLFYLVLFGLPGIAVYKAINTADSMIGHKDFRYVDFGRAAARTDDVANLVPARLTAFLIALAARHMPGADGRAALHIAQRDARKHASPNAGWPEAAMAGALGFALGGPRSYQGEVTEMPVLGEGRVDLGPDDIRAALALYERLLAILAAGVGVLALLALLL